jgi:hypothetical protein
MMASSSAKVEGPRTDVQATEGLLRGTMQAGESSSLVLALGLEAAGRDSTTHAFFWTRSEILSELLSVKLVNGIARFCLRQPIPCRCQAGGAGGPQ